jgi:hypothetical protein
LVSWKVRTIPCGRPCGPDALEVDLALELERAPIRDLVEARDEVEEGGLAGTVGTDEAGDETALDLQMIDIDCNQPSKSLAHVVDDEDRIGLGNARLPRQTAQRRVGGHGVIGHRGPSPLGIRRYLADGTP